MEQSYYVVYLLPYLHCPWFPSHSYRLIRLRVNCGLIVFSTSASAMSRLTLLRLPRTKHLQATTTTATLNKSSCRRLPTPLAWRPSAWSKQETVVAVPTLTEYGRRSQSTTGGSSTGGGPAQDARRQGPTTRPSPSLATIFSAAFRSTIQSIRNVARPQTLRDAYRKNPEEMVLALILYVIVVPVASSEAHPASLILQALGIRIGKD